MKLNINGKIALVTGSSQGIGRAIVQVLYNEGCLVALNGRDAHTLEEATSLLPGSIGIIGDMTEPAVANKVVAEVINKFGGLDILICNVGSGRSVPPGNESFEEWQRIFSVNLWGTTNTVEAAKNALIASKGNIVCISSICGLEVIPNAPITYSTAKAALNAYVRGIARPLGKHGVRINAVAPGNILFEQSIWAKKLDEDPAGVAAMLNREVVMGRLGLPEEVANLAAFLASPYSNFVTGQIWTLDGGQTHS